MVCQGAVEGRDDMYEMRCDGCLLRQILFSVSDINASCSLCS